MPWTEPRGDALPDRWSLRESLEYHYRDVGVSPYGTRVSWLPDQSFIVNDVLQWTAPRPDEPMHYWTGEETGSDGRAAPRSWADPLGERDVNRCRAAGRILQSYPSRLVMGTLLAASCTGMDSLEDWKDTQRGPGSWDLVKGTWFRDFALRFSARVLHGAYYVAGTRGADPLRQALYNEDSPTVLRTLAGDAASPGTYVWPLNVAAKIATFPGISSVAIGEGEGPGGLPITVYQVVYTTSVGLPREFRSTMRDLADVVRGVRKSVAVLAVVTAFVPGVGLLLAVLLAIVVFDDDWKAAADTIESAAEEGIDPNEALARLLLGIAEVCDLVDDLEDVEAFFSGDDADIHEEVTGMDRETLVALAESLREGVVAYSNPKGGNGTYDRLEEILERDSKPTTHHTELAEYAGYIVEFAESYYGHEYESGSTDGWASSATGGRITPLALSILNVPIVRASDTARDFYFKNYEATYDPSPGNEWSNGEAIAGLGDRPRVIDDERQRWADLASPTLQFVGALRLATVMLRELLHCDMPPLVLADLASLTGPLADAVRAELAGSTETACLVEILGGTSVAHAVAAYWRQVVMDWFLLSYAQSLGVHEEEGDIEENLDRAAPGLFELICWMRTPEQREVLRSLLGTLDADRQSQPVRTGGLLADLLQQATSGGLCDAWNALDCSQREALTGFITGLGCEPEFFDEDFDLERPDSYTGLTDREPGSEPDWPPPWLSLFDGTPWEAEEIDLYPATGLRASLPPGLAWAERVVEQLPPVEAIRPAAIDARVGAARVAWAPGWTWP
ncbi:MAG: hypothetical protein FJ102_20585 [Deltaproteobacteria bacterium]|nr:hypothetical protein [Deltaproteobacteria bacterium]